MSLRLRNMQEFPCNRKSQFVIRSYRDYYHLLELEEQGAAISVTNIDLSPERPQFPLYDIKGQLANGDHVEAKAIPGEFITYANGIGCLPC